MQIKTIWLAAAGATPVALLGLPIVLALRMALNAADGMLAREHGQASPLGFYLNELGDIISDAALYLLSSFSRVSRRSASSSPTSL